MFRYKSYKQTFIVAALIILLCLVCLTGATFALFTNDPNDGTIGIITTAGDVKVDIIDSSSGESLVGKVLQFRSSSEERQIIFEPGATFVTQGFKVKNAGNIPVNFCLYVSRDENINMEEFIDAFDVWITKDPTDLKSAERLTEFYGRLEVGQPTDEIYYLVIKMKETAGNQFQGKEYTGIGVTVYAVQGNVEIEE